MLLKGEFMIPDISIFFGETLFIETHPHITEALMAGEIDAGKKIEK